MPNNKKYRGVVVPTVTPVTKQQDLDEAGVEKLFALLYQYDVQPFIQGTTGEAPSLSLSVKKKFIDKASTLKKSGTHLYAGISSNCYQESVELAKYCGDHGVDVVVSTIPSYYALTESQTKKYFEQLADESPVPLIIYNIPATTHVSLSLSVLDDLSFHPNIVGAKDSERSDERLEKSLQLWKDRKDFSHFTGWAARSAQALIDGSDGIIPSTGNLYPGIYHELLVAVLDGNQEKAFELQQLSDQLGDIYQGGRTLGESLSALKHLMRDAGICGPFVMHPLQDIDETSYQQMISKLKTLQEKIS